MEKSDLDQRFSVKKSKWRKKHNRANQGLPRWRSAPMRAAAQENAAVLWLEAHGCAELCTAVLCHKSAWPRTWCVAVLPRAQLKVDKFMLLRSKRNYTAIGS